MINFPENDLKMAKMFRNKMIRTFRENAIFVGNPIGIRFFKAGSDKWDRICNTALTKKDTFLLISSLFDKILIINNKKFKLQLFIFSIKSRVKRHRKRRMKRDRKRDRKREREIGREKER